VSDYRSEESWARAQDADDPLRWCREEFELPRDSHGAPSVYFAGNSLGLMPKAARAAVDAELDDWSRLGVSGHLSGRVPWYSYHETVRQSLARLVGARPPEVVAMNSLTVNLHLLLVSLYQPAPPRTKVLLETIPFPSDAYAIESHLTARGLGPEHVLRADPDAIEGVLAERGREIAVVWLSAVHYFTGRWIDIARITRAARAAGCLVGLDLAHAIGNVELALHDHGVDFAVWCSYKYLNAGPGAVGGCYLHERHAGRTDLPRFAGWWGNDPATRFAMQTHPRFKPVASADGWQLSNPPILSFAPLRASLALFDRAGMDSLRRKSVRLTGYLEFLLEALKPRGIEVMTPREPLRRGAQLSIRTRGHDAEALVRHLEARSVIVDFRDPDVIRAAPAPLYNSFHDVWRFQETLRELL
jgi:kynureninase